MIRPCTDKPPLRERTFIAWKRFADPDPPAQKEIFTGLFRIVTQPSFTREAPRCRAKAALLDHSGDPGFRCRPARISGARNSIYDPNDAFLTPCCSTCSRL